MTDDERDARVTARNAYVTAHLGALVETAKAGYATSGRGFLAVEGDTDLPVAYIPARMFVEGDGGDAQLHTDIALYDPEHELVLLYSERDWDGSVESVIRVG